MQGVDGHGVPLVPRRQLSPASSQGCQLPSTQGPSIARAVCIRIPVRNWSSSHHLQAHKGPSHQTVPSITFLQIDLYKNGTQANHCDLAASPGGPRCDPPANGKYNETITRGLRALFAPTTNRSLNSSGVWPSPCKCPEPHEEEGPIISPFPHRSAGTF